MKPFRIPAALLAVLTALALTATACSSSSDTADTDQSAPASDVHRVDRDDLRRGGTLTWPVAQIPGNLNFQTVEGTTLETQEIMFAVMPVLMTVDAEGTVDTNPDYLTEARATATGDGQTVTYRINPDARWSDGTPLTWRDFQANWKALNGADTAYRPASTTGYDLITGVTRGADDREAVVTFSSPFGDWRSLFTPLYPASVVSEPDGFNTGYRNAVPVSAGPFQLDSVNRSAKTLTLVPDPDWWADPPLLDRIVYRALDPAATTGAFANGEIDFVKIGSDPAAYDQVRAVSDARVLRAAAPNWRQITFNAQGAILSDAGVRKALFHAIDREAIATSDLRGLDWPATLLNNHLLVNTQKGYQDNSGGLADYDPDQARRELDEAGWRQQGDIRAKNGTPLRLRFVAQAGQAVSTNEARLVQNMLREVGADVDITTVPADQFITRSVATGNFDLTAFAWFGTPFPASSGRSLFIAPDGADIQQNYTRTGSARIDQALDRAATSLDPDRTIADLNAADTLIWEQAAMLPLYQQPEIVAAKNTLANLGAMGLSLPVYQNIGFTA